MGQLAAQKWYIATSCSSHLPCIEANVPSELPISTAKPHPLLASLATSETVPHLLLVFAHPDDEVLAMGARLERLSDSRLLTLTDGAPSNGVDASHHGFSSLASYRQARRQELLSALADAGLSPAIAPTFACAVADQEASSHLLSLTKALASEIRSFGPHAILTHPYEGGHPDHDACAFAVHAAVALAALPHSPAIVEAPFYHVGENGSMVTGTFLENDTASPLLLTLSPEEQQRKARRFACFPSQAETLAQFHLTHESFRLAPSYDFTQRPHKGQLFYEQFPWGMTGDRFCQLAFETMQQLVPHALDQTSGRTVAAS